MRKNWTLELVQKHLTEIGPATMQDLIVETGKGKEVVRKCLNLLHREKRIFIKDWPFTGVQRSRLWAWRTSGQVDAKKPEARQLTELKTEWARRNKAILKARRTTRVGNPFAMLIK